MPVDSEGQYYAKDQEGLVVDWPPDTDASRLYYEAHVTIPPLDNRGKAQIDALVVPLGWRRSTFVLEKEVDTPNAFVSMRSASRQEILNSTATMVQRLVQLGYTVLRWKIEDTLLDSNRGDRLLPRTTQLSPTIPRVGIYEEPSVLGPVVAKRQEF